MGVVLDLTARAVSFISLIQDVLLSESCDTPFPILDNAPGKVVDKLKNSAERVESFEQRTLELIWVSTKTPSQQEVEKEFRRRSKTLLCWLQERKSTLKERLQYFMELAGTTPTLPDVAVTAGSGYSVSPSPHQWREAIRSYLYDLPEERISLAKALDYLPLLVVLASEGDSYAPKEQRLLQEWYTSVDISEKLLSKKELAVLKRWRTSGKDKNSEIFLVNDKCLREELLCREIPLPFEVIFQEELKEIEGSRKKRNQVKGHLQPADPLLLASTMQLRALALSGGGIRSATFNLGILQGLAQQGLLEKFDYLSTVSGGGYVGSWLTAWIKRNGPVSKIAERLNPNTSKDPRGEEVRPIHWLRMYSNYLTPNASIMSSDSWTMGMTWLRNTLLIQLIILLLLCSVLSLGAILLFWWRDLHLQYKSFVEVMTFSACLLGLGVFLAGWSMHHFDDSPFPPNPFKTRHTKILTNSLLGLAVLVAFLVSGWLYPENPSLEVENLSYSARIAFLVPAGLVAWIGLLLVAILGRYDRCNPHYQKLGQKVCFWAFVAILSAFAAALGVVMLASVWEVFYAFPALAKKVEGTKFFKDLSFKNLERLGFMVGVPLVLEVISLTVVMRMAFLGRLFPDERREWWGRLGAKLHRLALLWLLVTGCALFGYWAFKVILEQLLKDYSAGSVAVTGGWVALIGAAVKLAFSPKTSGNTKPSGLKASSIDTLVRVAPYLFGLGFLLIASNIVAWLIAELNLASWAKEDSFLTTRLLEMEGFKAFISFLVFLAATILLTWRVGVNEFSMHHFYRNRLMRAYLGASRRRAHREQTANPFTGFDKDDDIKLSTLSEGKGYQGPYLIINTALNASHATDLDRQDRKAESFVFTPLYCGFDIARTHASASTAGQSFDYGYRPTEGYAYKDGPALGTAMAISGAAANPNMGYHSSSATAFLLTAFNVRLGWWMGNPRREFWKSSDPRYGLAYVIYDLLGKTSTQDPYICLSDGGHFDNMGLYELIRRRCKFILLGDAEQDDQFTCEGLANAIRRCRIDFGVEITMDVSHITDRQAPNRCAAQHHAIGKILYPGDPIGTPSGILLYIKSSLTGEEPLDLREYALANPRFPHQSTGDQFFDEAQFESYRRLGLHIMEEIMRDKNIRKVLRTL